VRGCAEDLRRIAFFYPDLRQQALAVLQGFLSHPRRDDTEDRLFREVVSPAKETLRNIAFMERLGYKVKRSRHRRARYPDWLSRDIGDVCLPDL
jgi:hypothetical protein